MFNIVDNLPRTEYNTILVPNALNGSFPIALRKRYPKARIVCGEQFPFFHKHLVGLGFEVVEWNHITKDTMKIDCIVGNPPFQEISESGERKDQASNLWTKFWRKSFEITDDTATIALITPTTWLSPSADFKGSDNFVNGHDRLWTVFNGYTSYANITDVADHFPGIGSSFGYVIVDRSGRAGLTFSNGEPTNLGFLPKGNYAQVSAKLDLVNNLGSNFKINQDNSPDLRVSIPLTRTLTDSSIEILSGNSVPTAGSDKPELYLYIHVNTLNEADVVKNRLIDCLQLLNVDCKWSGFVNIQAVKLIRY